MTLIVYKPNTSGLRIASVLRDKELKKSATPKFLRVAKKRTGGRNASGKITVRHKGGGAKRFIRIIDFKRDKYDIPATVMSIEYDPNRNAHIALLKYRDGEKRYMIAPQDLHSGAVIVSSEKPVEVTVGNQTTLKNIPAGTPVYNIEIIAGKGGQMCRSAGNYAIVSSFDAGRAILKLPSGEIRTVAENCMATIGMASNPDYRNIRWGKAGRVRYLGIRPTVRGKVMNPVDHPHGGGEGKHPIGLKHPKTYTGKIALGVKTRRVRKYSDSAMISRRTSNKR